MPVVGLFGISNDGLNLAVNLLVVFLVVVYLALIVWTYLDASRRIDDSWIVACATAGSLFPFVGAMVYAILRPPEFIEDRKERELEIRAAELRVRQLGEQACPNCQFPVERSYLRCPSCQARLKDPCPSCSKPIDPRWAMCPYCETPIRRRAPEARQRSPRRERPERPERPERDVPARRTPSRAARAAAAREQARSGREKPKARESGESRPPARSKSRGERPERKPSGSRPGGSGSRSGGDAKAAAERPPVRSPSPGGDEPEQ